MSSIYTITVFSYRYYYRSNYWQESWYCGYSWVDF